MPNSTPQITVSLKGTTYTLSITNAPGGVITSGGTVVLLAVGAADVALTATDVASENAITSFGSMTAKPSPGDTTTLLTSVMSPFTLTVSITGFTSNSITITPQFNLTMNGGGGSPDPLVVGPGASVVISAVVGTVTTSPGGLFVGETSSDTISMTTAVKAFSVTSDAPTGDYDLSEPDAGPGIPLTGKIRVGSSTSVMA